jgi:membrane protein DedA with SNARE-associated domain
MAIESACIPIPSEIIMPLAGWMLIKGQSLTIAFNLLAGAFGALGCTIGSIIAYVVGAKGGRPFLNKYGKYILITPHDLDNADRWFQKNGDWAIFVTRLIPLVRSFISLPAGIAKMRIGKFLIYTFVGSFIWCTVLSFAGYLLGENWDKIRAVMRPFDPFIVGVVILLIALYIYRHIKHSRTQKES